LSSNSIPIWSSRHATSDRASGLEVAVICGQANNHTGYRHDTPKAPMRRAQRDAGRSSELGGRLPTWPETVTPIPTTDVPMIVWPADKNPDSIIFPVSEEWCGTFGGERRPAWRGRRRGAIGASCRCLSGFRGVVSCGRAQASKIELHAPIVARAFYASKRRRRAGLDAILLHLAPHSFSPEFGSSGACQQGRRRSETSEFVPRQAASRLPENRVL